MLMRRGQKSFNGFKFGTFIGLFPSDGAAGGGGGGGGAGIAQWLERRTRD